MNLIHLKDAEKVPIDIAAHKIFGNEKTEAIHLLFQPGEVLFKHANPFDVLFYVLQGSGSLEVGDETFTVGPDTLIEVPAGDQRGWTNTGSEELRVLVIKLL